MTGYQWYKDGSAIAGETSAVLPVTNVLSSDSGSYYVQISGECDDIYSDTILIDINYPVSITAHPVNDTICNGTDHILNVEAEGTMNGYEWYQDGIDLSNNNDTLALSAVTPSVSGYYYAIVLGACGNVITDTVFIQVNEPGILVTTPDTSSGINPHVSDTSIAIGEIFRITTSVSGMGPFTYQWFVNDKGTIATSSSLSDSSRSNPEIVSSLPSNPTRYYVEAMDVYGCSVWDSVLVYTDSLSIDILTPDTVIGKCETLATTVWQNGNADYYLWTPSIGLSNDTIMEPMIDGTMLPNGQTMYILEAGLYSGYSVYDTLYVSTDSSGIEIQHSGVSMCPEDTLTLTTNRQGTGLSYSWIPSDGSLSDTFAASPVITAPNMNAMVQYIVSMVDTFGCVSADTVDITFNTNPLVNLRPDTSICIGDNIVLDPGYNIPFDYGLYTYKWNDGLSTNTTLTVDTSGTYVVEITEVSTGCSAEDTIVIDYYPAPDAQISMAPQADTSICIGESVILYGNTSMNAQDYVWNSGSNSVNIAVSPVVDTIYTLTVTSSDGCTDQESIGISIWPLPTPEIVGEDDVYINETESYQLAMPQPNHQYSWSIIHDGSIVGASDSSQATVQWGTDTLNGGIIMVADTNILSGCYATDTFIVNINRPSHLRMNVTTTGVDCYGDTNGSLTAILTSSGMAPYTYIWRSEHVEDSITTTDTVIVVESLRGGTYEVVVIDDVGQSVTMLANVSQPKLLTLNVSKNDIRCHGDHNGIITVDPEGGTPGYDYEYDGLQETTGMVTGLGAGLYQVTVEDANGCTVSDKVRITEPDSLIVHVDVVEPYCPKENDGSITLDVEGANPFEITEAEWEYVYYWSDNGSTTNEHQNIGVGEYTVIIEDANKCKDTVVIKVLPEEERCFNIPTAFSPNGDGVNETWVIEGIGHYYERIVVEIYDRWGELLFKTKNYNFDKAWNGKYKGKPLPVDSYHFIITLNDGELTLTGQVTILR